ncbi:MAG TPA: DoxX family protein [Acidimicrobiales bacterium]|jgi:putative oxidoreductase
MESIDFGLLVVRVVIGGLFVAHGAIKFTERFGGLGLDRAGAAFAGWNLRPGRVFAAVAGVTEIAAGTLLILGLATPVAAGALVGVLVNINRTAHAGKGLWYWNDGWEYNLALLAGVVALAFTGAGAASLDSALGLDLARWAWGIGAVVAGTVSGAGVLALRRPATATTSSTAQPKAA